LSKHLFNDKTFRKGFFSAGYVFVLAYALLLLFWFGFPDIVAWTDSAVSVVLLGLSAALMSFCLAYYRPVKGTEIFIMAYTVALSFVWLGVSTWILEHVFSQNQAYLSWSAQALPAKFIICWFALVGMAIKNMSWYDLTEQREELSRKEATERLSREAELFKLRQQLQPHFLFNSLNSINALIMLRPQQAREMVLKLSDFLRGTLKREDQQWIMLPEELQYLQWYLDIEKVRFGHRLSTEVTASGESDHFKIPPMLLQPVVENAIKFGLYDTTDAITISIRAWTEDNMLHIQVQNPFDPSSQQPSGTGFGLTSIRRRLYLLFARHDLLETTANENIYTTLIKVPQLP